MPKTNSIAKRPISAFHITRAPLDSNKLSAILERRGILNSDQRRKLAIAHSSLTTLTPAATLLMEKFRRAGRRLGPDGNEIGTIGRYHYWRNCLYFAERAEAAFAEAAYYMHAFDGVTIGSFGRDYRVISAELVERPVLLSRKYSKEELVCHHHPLQQTVEGRATREGWRVIAAPSARRDGLRCIIVYDPAIVSNIVDVENVRLEYERRFPTVRWKSNLLARNQFVLRTVAH